MSYDPKGSDKTKVDIDVYQDMTVDFKTTKKTEDINKSDTTVNKNVHVKKDINENVRVDEKVYVHKDVKEYVHVDEKVNINETVNVNKNINENYTTTDTTNLNLNENVNKNINVNVNTWNVDVDVKASNIIDSSSVKLSSDLDVNDIDTSKLLNVADGAKLAMDDFNADILAIGESFNGAGNDSQFSVDQSNQLEDNDQVHNTSAHYANHQYPNVEGSVDASSSWSASGHEKYEHSYKWTAKETEGGKPPHHGMPDRKMPPSDGKDEVTKEASGGGTINGHANWYASAYESLHADLKISAPDKAFQTVSSDGGTAKSGDGITTAKGENLATDNEGNGTLEGSTVATADALADAEAFTASVNAGGNQQANFATLNVVGGNLLNAGDVAGGPKPHGDGPKGHDGDEEPAGGHYPHGGDGLAIRNSSVEQYLDDDVNDLDTSELLNVKGELYMDDFELDTVAIGNSFNGAGNDMQFDVNQVNDLADNDYVTGTSVGYYGGGWNGPFQSVSAYGGDGTAGNGIGTLDGKNIAYGNGGNGTIAGSALASGDAVATAQAFTANIVVGANLQVNNFTATVVGGDSSLVDDIGGHQST